MAFFLGKGGEMIPGGNMAFVGEETRGRPVFTRRIIISCAIPRHLLKSYVEFFECKCETHSIRGEEAQVTHTSLTLFAATPTHPLNSS